jgi:hypothetical protein
VFVGALRLNVTPFVKLWKAFPALAEVFANI